MPTFKKVHLLLSPCVFSQIRWLFNLFCETVPFTLGHITVSPKNNYNSNLQFLLYMQINWRSHHRQQQICTVFIYHQLISRSKTATMREHHQHLWKNLAFSHFNEDDCWTCEDAMLNGEFYLHIFGHAC